MANTANPEPRTAAALTPAALATRLSRRAELSAARRHVVAFSGGRDSSVVLDLARRALPLIDGASLLAVHVDHGWHPDSAKWAMQCAETARRFGVRLEQRSVDASGGAAGSPEALAREARYAALATLIGPGDVLWTAHHADDQMETVLLQLLRGAGVAGLAAMPALRAFGRGWHWRPLLDTPAAALAAYASEQGIEWIDDPANRDERFDRSFLRHNVIPQLQRRWPGGAISVARSAAHCAAAAALAEQMGDADLAAASDTQGRLDVPKIAALSATRQANLLRRWIASLGLATPTSAHLQRLRQDLLQSRHDATPCVDFAGVEVRRFRQRLYAMHALAHIDSGYCAPLAADTPLQLPGDLGTLQMVGRRASGIATAHAEAGLTVRFRVGGERIRPCDSEQTRELRTLFQERGVVPWMRDRIPLLYRGGELVAVADLWLARAFAAQPGEAGVSIQWCDHPPLY